MCPDCRASLASNVGVLLCNGCGRNFPLAGGAVPILLAKDSPYLGREKEYALWTPHEDMRKSNLGYRQRRFFPKSTPYDIARAHRRSAIDSAGTNGVILNLGSGRLVAPDERWVNLDVIPNPNCHIIADAHRLPFSDRSIAAVVSQNVFELLHPFHAADELMRVVSPGGIVFVSVAFVQPKWHEGDGFRYNSTALRRVFRDWDVLETGPCGGPFKALARLVEVAVDSVAPGRAAKYLARLFTAWLMHPLKYLDPWILRSDVKEMTATSAFILARRP